MLSSGRSSISQTCLGGASAPKEGGANLLQIFQGEEKSGYPAINWPILFRKLYENEKRMDQERACVPIRFCYAIWEALNLEG